MQTKAKSTDRELLHGAKWTAAANIAQEGISGTITFVLASFLGPAEFGVVAMAYVFVTFVELIAGFGFSVAILQRRDLTDEHLNSIFWLNQGVGLILALVTGLVSPWWARVNQMPELVPVILALTSLIPITGLSIVQVALIQRGMKFKGLAVRNLAGTIAGGVTGVVFAAIGWGIWSIVFQYLVRGIVSLVLLWRVSEWRPRLWFSWSSVTELGGFASKTFFGQIGQFLQQQADGLMIGVLLGPVALGLYRVADRLVEMILKFLPRAIQMVALPHFSRLQSDQVELNRSAVRLLHLNALLTFPAMGALIGLSPAVLVAIGDQWADAVTLLKLLCLVGAAKAVLMVLAQLIQAVGRPGRHALNTWLLAILNGFTAYWAATSFTSLSAQAQIGIVGGGRAAVYILCFCPLVVWQAHQATHLGPGKVFRVMCPPLLVAFCIVAAEWTLVNIWVPTNRMTSLGIIGVGCLIGLGIWMLSIRLFDSTGWSYFTKALSIVSAALRRRRGSTSTHPPSSVVIDEP